MGRKRRGKGKIGEESMLEKVRGENDREEDEEQAAAMCNSCQNFLGPVKNRIRIS